MPTWSVIAISVLGTCMNSAGLVLQKQGVAATEGRFGYLRNPKWLLGLLVMAAGWGLYLFSIDRAPLFMIQPIQGAGLIVFVAFGVIVLKERMGAAEWIAVAAMLSGTVMLAAAGNEPNLAVLPQLPEMIVFIASGALLPAVLMILPRAVGRRGDRADLVYGAAAGILMGYAAVFAKVMVMVLESRADWPFFFLSLALVIGGNLGGLLLLQAGFSRGRAVVVVTAQTAFTGVIPVAAGFIVLSERIPRGITGIEVLVGLAAALAGSIYLARFGGSAPRREA